MDAAPTALARRSPPVELCAGTDRRWLQFLESRPDATLFHHPAWSRILTTTYGHHDAVLVQIGAEGQILAGLPVVETRGTLGGRQLVALPYTDHCPPVARSPMDLALFTRSLLTWHETMGRGRVTVHGALAEAPGIQVVPRAVRHVLPLARSTEEIFRSFKGSPVARAIKKAQREGVETRISASPADLEPFYRLHTQTRRRLGVPVQPKRFIEALWTEVVLSGLGFTVFAYKEGQPIAVALFLAWNRNLIYKFAASDARYWELRPNNLVIWRAIQWACERGYQMLDFGRSDLDDQGLRDFKNRWGSIELPLVYSHIGATRPRAVPRAPVWALAKVIQASPPIVCRAMGELLYRRIFANVV